MRKTAIDIAWKLYGTPYVWGGDDPTGFDCSGFVVEILKSVNRLPHRGDWTAQMIYNEFSHLPSRHIHEGCLVFYGKSVSKITHIMFALNGNLVIGATGGGSRTKTPEDAARQNAFIKIRPVDYRSDRVAVVYPF